MRLATYILVRQVHASPRLDQGTTPCETRSCQSSRFNLASRPELSPQSRKAWTLSPLPSLSLPPLVYLITPSGPVSTLSILFHLRSFAIINQSRSHSLLYIPHSLLSVQPPCHLYTRLPSPCLASLRSRDGPGH